MYFTPKFFLFSLLFQYVLGCTNYIVTKGACEEGVNMFSYSADSFPMFGDLYHFAAGYHDDDEYVDVYDWNTDVYLGKIPQAKYTYNVIGNMNEYSLAIGETTWTGREDCVDLEGIVDYGTLIYLTLQRCKTAREAIVFINETLNKYGYYSTGESFTIADPDEIWIMDLIGRGPKQPGDETRFVFVAQRVPDGHISGHANQARTTTFPRNDPDNCIYSPDVYSFAVSKGWTTKSEEDFDFTEAYNPLNPEGTRACDGRVYAFYESVMKKNESDAYVDYVRGRDNSHRLPFTLSLKGDDDRVINTSVSLIKLQELIGNHYEGTEFDFPDDIGGTYFHANQRPRPLDWTVVDEDNVTQSYINERAAGCQQTAWNFIAQCKREMADGTTVGLDVDPLATPLPENRPNVVMTGGIFWFACDDTTTSVQIPIFPCTTQIPDPLSRDHANIALLSRNSIFWVNNLVANWAYTNWKNMHPVIKEKQYEERVYYINAVKQAEKVLATLAHSDPNVAVQYANLMARQYADKLLKDWNEFYGYLFQRFFDGMEHTPIEGETTPKVTQLRSEHIIYQTIVDENPGWFDYPDESTDNGAKLLRKIKRTIAK